VVFFFAIGITNAFIIQIALYMTGTPSIWIAQYLIERFGRRPILIISALAMAACTLSMGGLGLAPSKTEAVDNGIVSMVFIFLFMFNIGWGPTVWAVTSEISTGRNRGKLMLLSTASSWFFSWAVTFSFPYLFNADAGNLGPKTGFIYGVMTLGAAAWVWVFLPETAGRSLEEIHELFELGVPARQFSRDSKLGCRVVCMDDDSLFPPFVAPERHCP
jgi:MFS transporter, SP family, sugar:H+ symporter